MFGARGDIVLPDSVLPPSLHAAVVRRHLDGLAALARRVERKRDRAAVLAERAQADLASTLGARTYTAMLAFFAAQQATADAALLAAPARKRGSLRETMEARAREGWLGFAARHNIDEQALLRAHRRAARPLIRWTTDATGLGRVQRVRAPDDAGEGEASPTRPLLALTTPFPECIFAWFTTWFAQGMEIWAATEADCARGLVAASSNAVATRNDAGQFAEATANVVLGFSYRMETVGRIAARVELESEHAQGEGFPTWRYIVPWSFPVGQVVQENYLSMKCDGRIPGNWVRRRLYNRTAELDKPPPSPNSYLPDRRYFFEIFSDRSFAAGEDVLIWIGTWTRNAVTANQAYAASLANFRWLIRSVEIRSTGDPRG